MEFASPIFGQIVQSLMVPVKKHLGFLISSTKFVKDMNKKMDQLECSAKEVQDEWDKAVVHTEVVPAHAEPWLKDVEKLNERRNLLEATGCFNVTKRYKIGKQAYGILEEIKVLENDKSKIEFTHTEICLAEAGSTSTVSMGTQNKFESRDLIFNKALEALKSNEESQRMIALCGMGGIGKTTMMELLKKVVEDSKMFDWVIKVVIGENTDSISLQQAISQYIGKNLAETDKDARADRLQKIFEKQSQGQKKTLVIMDDLWKEVDLTDVGLNPLPNGFKLLFTSRFEDVCFQMGVRINSIFRVGLLNDIEAQSLFSTLVGPSPLGGDDADLKMIGDDIAKKCGGLPIAIVTIAKSLRGNIKEAWKEALSNLQHCDLQDLDGIVHKVFEMSYNNLKKEDEKAIFLLSGLFPDDFNIPIEYLMMYGWGLKLFAKVHTLTDARMRANICVSKLIHANLLTKSDHVGCVKMHDLVRAFVLSNFSKVKQASIVNHDNMSREHLTKDSYERILLKCTGMSEFPPDFDCQNLSFLMLIDGYEFFKYPEDMHKRMKKLEVASYENMGTPVLPITFKHSTTLRTLCLHSCSLTSDISFLGILSNMETLILANCNVRRLPSAIGKLKKLKLLDLTGCVDLRIDDGVLQDLESSLEELYMRASKGRPAKFTPANYHELEKLSQRLFALELEFIMNEPQLKNMSFRNLTRFRLSIGCELKHYEKYSFRNSLHLLADCNELKECNIGHLFKETEELRLQVKHMIHLGNVSMHHTFFQLRFLHISKCAELTYLFTVDVANGLGKLERLTISDCSTLEKLIGGDSDIGMVTLKKLNFISLECLPNMVSLCDNVIELPEMIELRLDDLPNFTSIHPDSNSNTSSMRPLLNKEGVMPKLEKLDIFMMKNLKQIWPCQISSSEKNVVSMLRQIRVRKCGNLTNLLPINPLPLLELLEEVKVESCGSVEVLFNIDFESMGEHGRSRLRRIEVNGLGKLEELWRLRGINNLDILVNSFKGVEEIIIRNCERFRDVFTPTTTNFDLGALTKYVSENISLDWDEWEIKNKLVDIDQKINNATTTYPSYLLHTCHHLQHLELWNDERVKEVVFDMDSSSGRQLATIQPPLLPLPHLQTIDLLWLKKMSHVWKCNNWNKFLIPQPPLQFPFQNLRDIILRDCDKIKYLFSPLMAKYLSNLKRICIIRCVSMEEVISSRDDENATSTSSYQNTTLFPCLDTLDLARLPSLKNVDDGRRNTWTRSDKITNSTIQHDHLQSAQVTETYWTLCQYTRQIIINKCESLSCLIPWYAVGQMKRLQELKIEKCEMLEEIFQSTSMMNNNSNNDGTSLPNPTPKGITTIIVPQLSNLKNMGIYECNLLSHIFTFSTLKTLNHLKELKLKRCKAIQVIVKEENKTSSSEVVVFPHLETLELDGLPYLKGFFLGKNDFQCPSLVNVMINDCPQWLMFTFGELETPNFTNVHTSLGKYSLERGFNFQTTFPTSSGPTTSRGMPSTFHNLIEINIEDKDVGSTIIPSNALLQLEKLQKITIDTCEELQEIFEVVALEGTNRSQTLVKIPNLTQVKLVWVDDLKYLWKSNQWMTLEFPNLTTVYIHSCFNLKYVFTCSMVASLVQLKDLHIKSGWSIKVIVKVEEEEVECDANVNEIMLPRLNSIKLDDLISLEGFCLGKETFSLPALDTLQIKACPEIAVFTKGHVSSPELKEIDTSFGMCDMRTDINSFIEIKKEEGHQF